MERRFTLLPLLSGVNGNHFGPTGQLIFFSRTKSCPSFGDSSFDGSLVGYQAAVPPSPWACCIQKGAWGEAWCPERVQPPPINRNNKQEVGRPGPSSEVGVEARASLSQNVLKMTVRVRNAWAEGRKRQMMSPVSGT